MAFSGLDIPMKEIIGGSIALIACLSLYLAWWVMTFRPGSSSTPLGTFFIILASFLGLAAVVILIIGLTEFPTTDATLPAWKLLTAGIVAYLILFLISVFLLKRQVTTELALIVGWCVLEIALISAFAGTGQFSGTLAIALVTVLLILALGSIVCYLLYYNLEATAGWIDGMIPLAAAIAYQVAIVVAAIATA